MSRQERTCSEWNPLTDTICGLPAPFHLKIEDLEMQKTTLTWKCAKHIRRYHHIARQGKIKTTITAYKDNNDVSPSRHRRAPSALGSSPRRRGRTP